MTAIGRAEVVELQLELGLPADGIVGPLLERAARLRGLNLPWAPHQRACRWCRAVVQAQRCPTCGGPE